MVHHYTWLKILLLSVPTIWNGQFLDIRLSPDEHTFKHSLIQPWLLIVYLLLSMPTADAEIGFSQPKTNVPSLSVCFPHDISKTDAARITKLDTQMLHDESWKSVYFRVKVQCHKSQKQCRRGSLHSCECSLASSSDYIAHFRDKAYPQVWLSDWFRGTKVECRSLAGELSMCCTRPAADGWPLMWVNRPL